MNVKQFLTVLACAGTIAIPCAGRAQTAAAPAGVAVGDFASMKSWFAWQPGSHLRSERIVAPAQPFAVPKATDSLFGYTADRAELPQAPLRSAMRGYASGDDRLDAAYDPQCGCAVVFARAGSERDLVLTRIRSTPDGLPVTAIVPRTANGVQLGMSRDEVIAIEGAGTLLQFPDHKVLAYDQGARGHLAFWFVDHKLAGIEIGGS